MSTSPSSSASVSGRECRSRGFRPPCWWSEGRIPMGSGNYCSTPFADGNGDYSYPNNWSGACLRLQTTAIWAIFAPFFLANSSTLRTGERSLTRKNIGTRTVARSLRMNCCFCKFQTCYWRLSSRLPYGVLNAYVFVVPRALVSSHGRANIPFANGLHGMHPTPRCW